MSNDYAAARQFIQRQVRELQGMLPVIDRFERLGLPIDTIMQALEQNPRQGRDDGADSSHRSRASGSNGSQSDEAGFNEAMDAILSDGQGRSVNAIIQELADAGRSLDHHTRPDVYVRNTLNRCRDRYGWREDAEVRPRIWYKPINGQRKSAAAGN